MKKSVITAVIFAALTTTGAAQAQFLLPELPLEVDATGGIGGVAIAAPAFSSFTTVKLDSFLAGEGAVEYVSIPREECYDGINIGSGSCFTWNEEYYLLRLAQPVVPSCDGGRPVDEVLINKWGLPTGMAGNIAAGDIAFTGKITGCENSIPKVELTGFRPAPRQGVACDWKALGDLEGSERVEALRLLSAICAPAYF